MHPPKCVLLTTAVGLALLSAPVLAQGSLIRTAAQQGAMATPSDPAIAFLAPFGLQNFPAQYVGALQAFVGAQHLYEVANFGAAKAVLDGLWAIYPTGHPSWGALPMQPFGINIGSPAGYYGLRMLSDMADWRAANPTQGPPPRSVRLTVVVVGKSSGVEPQNVLELFQGSGVFVNHDLDARVEAENYRAVHESLRLFGEYVLAITQGQLGVETQIVELPNVDLAVRAEVASGGRYFAGLVDPAQVWPQVPQADIDATDWWWVIYPSHVPEQHADFQDTEFVTGGMGTGEGAASPLFLIDDRWLVRKPPHIGAGEYSDIERRAYLPQWLQHEFFHHLFRTYPGFGLEDSSHQWFDRNTWPADFLGSYEADYFHEALLRRLQAATPPLHVALRYSNAGAQWGQLTIDDLLGTYRREPIENAWHVGDIRMQSGQLEWRNTAGVSWNLLDAIPQGDLLTGPDCPYFPSYAGKKFDILFERDANGDLTSQIRGFAFNGEVYERQ